MIMVNLRVERVSEQQKRFPKSWKEVEVDERSGRPVTTKLEDRFGKLLKPTDD